MVWNERIKEQREARGLTLQEVAEKLGVSESTAQRYESKKGIKNIPYDVLVKYSNILGVSPAYLMGWDTPEQKSFSYFVEMQMHLLGWSILYDSEGNVLLSHNGKSYEITEMDHIELEQKMKSYLEFLLYDLVKA